MLNEEPIRLIVKAPNQKIEDQTIECMLDWTVKTLKTHLSNVYPSKPKTNQQKLIYSGKLLHDSLQLKDVLRQDDGITHTMHLVCAPSFENPGPSITSSSMNSSRTSSASSIPPSSNSSYNELRYRNQPNSQFWNGYGSGNVNWFNFPGSPSTPNNTLMTAEQIAWIQQMYTQYQQYYSQYALYYSQTTSSLSYSDYIGTSPHISQAEAPIPPNQNVRNNQPANQNIRLNAQGGPVVDDDDDEEEHNRDWLDWIYSFFRVAVIFMAVYFYSSLGRFVLVMTSILLVYLYQDGWFRINRRQNANNNIVNNRQQANHDAANPVQRENVPPPAADQQNNIQHEGEEIENHMDAELDNQEQNVRSPLTFAWTFITTFFASLIPERPQPINDN